jgi:hypothetical protein
MDTTTQAQEPLTPTLKPIYARFTFPEQQQALDFAGLITERGWTATVAYAQDRARWQTTVRQEIHPVFREVTIWLTILTARATPLGGENDGWGYE